MPYEYMKTVARYYDATSTGIPGDVAYFTDLARGCGGPVLELGCGTGRITAPIAEAGVPIVGLDLSPDMLAVARRRLAALPEDVRNRVTLVEGDMRNPDLEQRCPLIIIPCRAFQHVLTPEDQRTCLLNLRGLLTEDGRLVIDLFDPSIAIIAESAGRQRGVVKHLTTITREGAPGRVEVYERRSYDLGQQLAGRVSSSRSWMNREARWRGTSGPSPCATRFAGRWRISSSSVGTPSRRCWAISRAVRPGTAPNRSGWYGRPPADHVHSHLRTDTRFLYYGPGNLGDNRNAFEEAPCHLAVSGAVRPRGHGGRGGKYARNL